MRNIVSRCLHTRATKATALSTAIGVAASALSAAPIRAQSFGSAFFGAFISSTGVVRRGLGVVSAKRTAVGQFQVAFSRPLSSCYFTVSVVGSAAGSAASTISANDTSLLIVRTYDGSGTVASAAFNVVVVCGS